MKATITLLITLLVALGWYSYSNRTTIDKQKITIAEYESKIEEITRKYEEQLHINSNTQTHTTTTETKPDGTTTVTDTTITNNTTTDHSVTDNTHSTENTSHNTSTTSENEHSVIAAQTKYSIFANNPLTTFSKNNVHVGFGFRLATTPVWAQVEAGLDKQVRVGLRLDF